MFQSAVSSILELCILVIVFLGVLGLAYFVTKKMAYFKQGTMKNKNMRIVEVMNIGQNQYIYIIQVGTEYHLFATAKDKIEYCSKIENDVLQVENLVPRNFTEELNQFRQNKQEKRDEDTEI